MTLVPALLSAITVQVSAAPCVEVDTAEVQRIAALELSTEAPHLEQAREVVVRLECSAENVTLTVDDLAAPRPLVRRIPLAKVEPAARARTAALAITELVAASWKEPVVAVAPRRLRLGALGGAALFPALLQFGGGVRAGYVEPGRFGVLADFTMASGAVAVSAGSISVTSLSGSLSLAWSIEVGRWELLPALGLRLGAAQARGTPATPDAFEGATISGPWLGALGSLGVAFTFASLSSVDLRAVAILDGGVVIVPVRARVDGQQVTGLSGGWGQLSLGVEAKW